MTTSERPVPELPVPELPVPEMRVCTHDGHIWPLPRHRMLTRFAITIRMADDIMAMIRARGADAVITIDDLVRLGWLRTQVASVDDAVRALIDTPPSDDGASHGHA